MTYRRTTDYVASSLDFLFTNQYSLGGGVFVFNSVGALVQVIFCVTLLSNLIYLALQELMSLRDHEVCFKTEMKTNEDTYLTHKYPKYYINKLIWLKQIVDKHVLELDANPTSYIILKHQN